MENLVILIYNGCKLLTFTEKKKIKRASKHTLKACARVCVQGWVQVTPSVTLSNSTPPNNLLLNSCNENIIIELHILYGLNMHVNFHDDQM